MRLSKKAATLAVLLGVFVGTGLYTFKYAEGFSYFGTQPETCTHCHIMNPQYDSWQKSSHHAAATCVECHLPHDVVAKYIAKAENGYHHSKAFTFQSFHEPIMIKAKNRQILQDNCFKCHEDMVHDLFKGASTQADAVRCIHCHASVGHGGLPTSIGGADRGEANERKQHDQAER